MEYGLTTQMITGTDLQIALFTLLVSGLAVLLALPFAALLAYWTSRKQGWFVSLVNGFVTLPLALPPVAVGIFLLKAIGTHSPAGTLINNLGIRIAFSWKGVAMALFVMSFPLIYLPAKSGFDSVDLRMEQISRSLGRSRLYTFFQVTVPLAFRGIVAGILLGWARAIGEFGCTIILAGDIPGETRTLSLAIFHRFNMGNDGAAVRLSVLAGLLILALVLIAAQFQKRGNRL